MPGILPGAEKMLRANPQGPAFRELTVPLANAGKSPLSCARVGGRGGARAHTHTHTHTRCQLSLTVC